MIWKFTVVVDTQATQGEVRQYIHDAVGSLSGSLEPHNPLASIRHDNVLVTPQRKKSPRRAAAARLRWAMAKMKKIEGLVIQ